MSLELYHVWSENQVKSQNFLYKYNFGRKMYFNKYFKTYITGSPFIPTILNNIIGSDKEIKRKIFISQFFIKRCKILKIIEHQMIIKIAVE